jgi:hypothetical protein
MWNSIKIQSFLSKEAKFTIEYKTTFDIRISIDADRIKEVL